MSQPILNDMIPSLKLQGAKIITESNSWDIITEKQEEQKTHEQWDNSYTEKSDETSDLHEKRCCYVHSQWGCGFESESGDLWQPSVIIFTQGIHSSCCSEGSSEGSASSPGWSPGPADPEPACGASAPAWGEMKQQPCEALNGGRLVTWFAAHICTNDWGNHPGRIKLPRLTMTMQTVHLKRWGQQNMLGLE